MDQNNESPKTVQLGSKSPERLAKDENKVNYVSVAFVVVAIIVSLFLIFGRGNSKSEEPGLETFKNAPPEMIPPKNK